LKGLVDDSRRALIDVRVSANGSTPGDQLTVWIDTAFDGYLVCNRTLIQQLGLTQWAATEAILADGSRITLESYTAYVEWFGTIVEAQVIANEGAIPLLGTEFLAERSLHVDYKKKSVEII
jgi:clan AA aspartic protease